jgi:drug/metabolite transporter (DMT)-like permease
MTKLIMILLAGLLCEAIGVMFLKEGMNQVGDVQKVSTSEIWRVVKKAAANANIWLGVFFEAVFFGTLLVLLSKGDISFVWPMTALSFVFTTFAAKMYLHEQVSPTRWAGVAFIMIGAALITWSEKAKEKADKPAAAITSRP